MILSDKTRSIHLDTNRISSQLYVEVYHYDIFKRLFDAL